MCILLALYRKIIITELKFNIDLVKICMGNLDHGTMTTLVHIKVSQECNTALLGKY